MSSKTKTTAAKEEAKPALVPKLRFPEFRGAEGWEKAVLGDLLEITSSKRVHESDWTDHGVPFYRAREIVSLNSGEPITPLFISEDLYRDNAKRSGEIVPGDLLVTGVGSIGVPYLVKANDRFYFKDGNIIWLKNRDTKLQGQFLLILYGTQFVQNQIKTMAGVGTVGTYTIDNANKTVLLFPVDDIEQQKISECLSSVGELMAAQARKVDALKTHKKGLMQQLFPQQGETQPRLRFPEFQNAGEWELRKAGTLFANRVTKGEQGLPIYSVTMHDGMVKRDSFNRNFYDIEDAAGNKKVCKDDIAYNMMRMWQGALGVAPEDCLVSPAYIVLAPMKDAVPVFFQYLFKLPATLLLLTSHSRGLTKDRLRLYYDDFARISLRCPAPPEQQRIASCLSSLDTLVTAETQKLEALKTHKKGLMQQLFPSPAEVEA